MSINLDEQSVNNMFINFYPPDEDLLKKSFLSKKFNYCIPLGFNCNSASCLNNSDNRIKKLPFDWMQALVDNYKRMLLDMYNNDLKLEIHTDELMTRHWITAYDAYIPHEPTNNTDEIKINYIKYFKRLEKILQHNNNKNKFDICIVITDYHVRENIVNEYKKYIVRLLP